MLRKKIGIFVGIMLCFFSIFFGINLKNQRNAFAVNEEIFSITFVLNNGEDNQVFSASKDSQIEFPEVKKTGYSLDGWYLDELFSEKFSETTLTQNIQVYAKWTINTYTITLKTNGGSLKGDQIIEVDFNSSIPELEHPKKDGYTFFGWYSDSSLSNMFTLTKMPNKNIVVFAKWNINEYIITFNAFNGSNNIEQKIYYDFDIEYPQNPTRQNYVFVGWFLDNCNVDNPPENPRPAPTKMPSENIVVFAKWEEKLTIVIDKTPQKYNFKDNYKTFKNFSSINDFVVKYKVDGIWTTESPINAGKYDIQITRSEDEIYKSFKLEIKDGLIISPAKINYNWLIATLFILGIMEFVTAIFVRYLKKMKSSKTFSFVPISFLLANQIIPTNQFILLITSGILALSGFVFLVYELVKLHRTNPNYDFSKSQYDNRNGIEEAKSTINPNETYLTHKAMKKENNDLKYSVDDINAMLNDKDYFNKQKENDKK